PCNSSRHHRSYCFLQARHAPLRSRAQHLHQYRKRFIRSESDHEPPTAGASAFEDLHHHRPSPPQFQQFQDRQHHRTPHRPRRLDPDTVCPRLWTGYDTLPSLWRFLLSSLHLLILLLLLRTISILFRHRRRDYGIANTDAGL
ncbi:hypothetical protein LTS18_007476, partial [Coniosporium uncinatum]